MWLIIEQLWVKVTSTHNPLWYTFSTLIIIVHVLKEHISVMCALSEWFYTSALSVCVCVCVLYPISQLLMYFKHHFSVDLFAMCSGTYPLQVGMALAGPGASAADGHRCGCGQSLSSRCNLTAECQSETLPSATESHVDPNLSCLLSSSRSFISLAVTFMQGWCPFIHQI